MLIQIFCFADDKSTADENDDEYSDDIQYQLDDMVLTKRQMDGLFNPESRRNGVVDPDLYWPNKTVPVFVTDDYSESQLCNFKV